MSNTRGTRANLTTRTVRLAMDNDVEVDASLTILPRVKPLVSLYQVGNPETCIEMRPIEAERLARALVKQAALARKKAKG